MVTSSSSTLTPSRPVSVAAADKKLAEESSSAVAAKVTVTASPSGGQDTDLYAMYTQAFKQ